MIKLLKSLNENKNDETKMTLMAHSMGGLVSLHFLTGISEIPQEWKDKYIGAWDGGVYLHALQLYSDFMQGISVFQNSFDLWVNSLFQLSGHSRAPPF